MVGTLIYSGGFDVELDDRTLAHLQIVILSKLRRAESCSFSWKSGASGRGDRETIWINPSTSLRFRYRDVSAISINPEWVAALTATAGRGDIVIVDEPRPHRG